MALQSVARSSRALRKSIFEVSTQRDPLIQCLAPRFSCSMATEAPLPTTLEATATAPSLLLRRPPPPERQVLTTVYKFPEMEPLRFTHYPANQLHLPLRRDILHRAIIFEADSNRQGTANAKRREEVHGSNRKIRPQKGTGSARLGDKKSPMLRGGGVAHGPRPRDFSTKLPRKIYDLAWRTALSYRYRRGELLIVQKFDDEVVEGMKWMEKVMEWNRLGHGEGKSLVITRRAPGNLLNALNTGPKARGGKHGQARSDADLALKDLLSMGRLVVEKRALDNMLKEHSSDINLTVPSAVYA